MIKEFRCRETEKIFNLKLSRKFPPDIQQTALRKLEMINAAVAVHVLAMPPGNRLEKLRGRREGQCSIRINSQWRICFRWDGGDAYEVEICDYH